MPDTLGLSTGVSFGLLAGIVSGVCYLVASGFNWPRRGEKKRLLDREEEQRRELCRECGELSYECYCSDESRRVKFEEGRWFLRQVQKTLSYMHWSISTDELDAVGRERSRSRGRGGSVGGNREGCSVREFMERLSERLAGGALDSTSVASIYDHPLYLPPVRDGARVAGDRPSASDAHARLKRLVNRVIEEAMALPALAHYAQQPPREPDAGPFESRTYEDLLASAILNKVIERYQTESTGGRSGGASSGIHSASASPTPSATSSSSASPPRSPHTPAPLHDEEDDDERPDSEWEHHDFRGEEAHELPRRVPFPEFGGDIIHYSENRGHIDDQELEEMSGSDLQAADGCWEENWLFQKKKVKTLQSVPVPMLVPNPIEELRAMIGDREADDTSDLSEAATDTEEESEYKSDIGRALHAKTVIGGKNPTEQLLDIEASEGLIKDDANVKQNNDSNEYHETSKDDVDSSTEVQELTADFNSSNDSVVVVEIDSGPLNKAEFAVGEIHRTHRNPADVDEVDGFASKMKIDEDNKENTNSLINHQLEGEYTETIDKPVQRYSDSLRKQHAIHESTGDVRNGDASTPEPELRPGSVADRERRKWLKAVEMPNNPYSAEAIQKRLSHKSTSSLFDSFLSSKSSIDEKVDNGDKEKEGEVSSSTPKVLKDVLAEEVPQYKRYGRDYYINEARRSTGGRKSAMSSTSSLSSISKVASVDRLDEFASPVSASSSLSDLEATSLHTNIVRAVLRPRDASANFAINPIFESPDKKDHDRTDVHKDELINAHLIHKFNSMIIVNNENSKQTVINQRHHISIEYEDKQTLFSAKPAFVEDDTDERLDNVLKTDNLMSKHYKLATDVPLSQETDNNEINVDESLVSSSSMEDSMKIYNVPKGEIVKTPRDNVDAEHECIIDLDNNDNIVIQDKTTEMVDEANGVGENYCIRPPHIVNENMGNGSNGKIIDEFEVNLPKVKDLVKKFVVHQNNEEIHRPKSTHKRRNFNNDYELEVVNRRDPKLSGKHNHIHSLTARSLSREFREGLRLSMATPIKVPGGANEIPDGDIAREDSRPPSPVPQPGTLKNKLAFFESLKF